MLGTLVTAGSALLPDVDHHSATIAQSGGMITQAVAEAAGHLSGGHRHGLHTLLAVAGFTVGTVLASRWEAVLPGLGLVPAGSGLVLLALLAFAALALKISRSGTVALWLGAAVMVVVVLAKAPEQLAWLPTSVLVGVVAHLAGDMLTVGGVPLLWPWVPKPPEFVSEIPVVTAIWKPNGYVAVPLLGKTGSWLEWTMCTALSLYVLYGLAATTGLLTVAVF